MLEAANVCYFFLITDFNDESKFLLITFQVAACDHWEEPRVFRPEIFCCSEVKVKNYLIMLLSLLWSSLP